ncbi:MAG: hypothetical protein K2M43_02235 [Mycoplasmoidaceae bacterium]|nr:hypothetical protein [Mycoplasmoidaceae bacterium]
MIAKEQNKVCAAGLYGTDVDCGNIVIYDDIGYGLEPVTDNYLNTY